VGKQLFYTENFDTDLPRGKHYEQIVLNYLKKTDPNAYMTHGKDKRYDIYLPGLNFGIEVKYDEKSNDTGNILIELEFPVGTYSGLNTTEAKYWVITDGKEYVIVKPEGIRAFASENNIKSVTKTGNGDSHPKLVWLFRKKIFFSRCKLLMDTNTGDWHEGIGNTQTEQEQQAAWKALRT